jgi:drug/metabolite transporter (DMT)-like permease
MLEAMLLATALALSAALLNAGAALLQQQGIHLGLVSVERTDALRIARNLRDLAQQPRWVWGWSTDLVGYVLQAAALYYGSVALVQPLMTAQLLFTLGLVSWQRHEPPRFQAWLGAGAICTGLAVLLVTQGGSLSGAADRTKVLQATVVVAVLVTMLVIVSRNVRQGVLFSAVAAGLCTAMSAVFTKLTVDDLVNVGLAGTAQDWPGYLLLVSTFAGFLTIQAGFASGPLTWAVAAGLITDPIASYLVGILAFDVTLPADTASIASAVIALGLLVVGIVLLAHVSGRSRQHRAAMA